MKTFLSKFGLLTALAAVVILVLSIFLFTEDGDYGVTGIQTMAQEGRGFWVAFFFFVIAAVYTCYKGLQRYKITQETSTIYKYAVVAIVFISIAFGKGCTDKANGGVTTAGGPPTPSKIDSTRQAVDPNFR